MNKNSQGLTKICSHCGEQKPLAAFLQLSGTEGATYGTVCASCRKAHIEKMNRKRESGEATTSGTGFKIDAKAKVQAEKDKRELRKEQKENELKESEKKEEDKSIKQESRHTVSHNEKKHREHFLEKRSFLDSSKKGKPAQQAVFGGEAQKAEAAKLDFASGPVEYTRVSGQVKTSQSPIFQAFKSWLGNAPIVSAAEKATKTKQSQNKTTPQDAFTEQVDKLTGPKARK